LYEKSSANRIHHIC
jgi:hypothetical protein